MSYVNQSMSERALEAYGNGEKPLSKWTKSEILENIDNVLEDKDLLPLFKKMSLKRLRSLFLTRSSWHHTGKFYNKTNFYSLNENNIYDTSASDLRRLIEREKMENKEKRKEPNLYITAHVNYVEWIGTRKHPKRVIRSEVVRFRSEDKLVRTSVGNKRLSSLDIVKKVEQKTKYAKDKKVL